MKKVILSFIILLFLSTPCFSIDLNSETLVDTVIESLEKNPERWIITSNDLCYSDVDIKELRKTSFPDVDDRVIVSLSYSVLDSSNFVKFDKPIEKWVDGEDEKRLIKAIRLYIYKRLHNEISLFDRINEPQKYKMENPKAPEPESKDEVQKETSKDKMKKL